MAAQEAQSREGRSAGALAEVAVADSLAALGWTVLGRNVRFGHDEIDLVAVDPGPPTELVAVEVRWRTRRDYGLAEETLDRRKRLALRRALAGLRELDRLADGTPVPRVALRFDVVAVEPPAPGHSGPRIRHHRAFRL
ncbi:MAG: YraN family protein [Chloroflexota bacterium]